MKSASKLLILFSVVFMTSAMAEGNYRLKTFREILSSLEVATNMEAKDPLLLEIYNVRKTSLPQTGRLEEFNEAGASTFFGLTSHFCNLMIKADMKKDPEDRWAHGDVDFSLPVESALSPTVRTQLISLYGELFWLRPVEADEMEYLLSFMGQNLTMFGSLPEAHREVLMATCSVMGASLASLVVEK